MATHVHLVRHGEVHDPDHIVYASLPSYDLSPTGREQARAVARYLGRQPVVAIWSSPLLRAVRTAEPIAARAGLPVKVEPELREWQLMDRWSGVGWEDLPTRFPGEVEAFLDHPHDLPFAPESLQQLAHRAGDAIRRLAETHLHGDVVMVSHSATVRAATLDLTGAPVDTFWDDTPDHCAVTTLRPGTSWKVQVTWTPPA